MFTTTWSFNCSSIPKLSKEDKNTIRAVVKAPISNVVKGAVDVKGIAEVSYYTLKKRRGYNLMAARHHYEAILNAESRLEKLRTL